MDDDELYRLNSLHRFSKHSRLVLEAHSHCEVPAGCGGAVLQWIDPDEGAPVRITEHSSLAVETTFIDGKQVQSSSVRLKPGPHQLAMFLLPARNPALGRAEPWLMVRIERRERALRDVLVLATAVDGSWRYRVGDANQRWQELDFDDSGWTPMAASRITAGDLDEWRRGYFEQWTRQGTAVLALPRAAKGVWVRRRFMLGEVPR